MDKPELTITEKATPVPSDSTLSEKAIIDRILAAHPMMFRNAVGYGIAADPKRISHVHGGFVVKGGSPIHFGLFKGSSDMIGWNPVVITADMVGKTVAIFQSIEVKTMHDRLSDEQRAWNRAVLRDGGICQVWHATRDGLKVITGEEISSQVESREERYHERQRRHRGI